MAKKQGVLMIVGGFIIAAITLGGFYISSNPGLISKLQYKRDSARHEKLAQVTLVAPESCVSVSADLFVTACTKLEENDYEEDFDFLSGFNQQQLSCMRDAFRVTAAFKLKYDGDPASNLENMNRDEEFILHACGASEDLTYYRPDLERDGAKQVFDAWYQWKHEEELNHFH